MDCSIGDVSWALPRHQVEAIGADFDAETATRRARAGMNTSAPVALSPRMSVMGQKRTLSFDRQIGKTTRLDCF
jgi:hypothetical protein